MVPDLPAGFVLRPIEFNAMLNLLIANQQEDAAITAALRGPAGFGKTSLATALCRNREIVAKFKHGILWVTLGETPDVQRKLTELYAALTGERPGFLSEEDAARELALELENRDCLLVVDDVFQADHLRPFLRGAKGCVRLITTQKMDVVIEAHAEARLVEIGAMKELEAVEMLIHGLDSKPANTEPFKMLAERLGNWPLLLNLANGALRLHTASDYPMAKALSSLNEALDRQGLTAFDRDNATERGDAVSKTMGASLELLTSEQRERYAELAIFANSTDIPLSAVGVLWGKDRFQTEQLVKRLANGSLLKFYPLTDTVWMPGVLRIYQTWQLKDPATLHRRLLSGWGDFHKLPDAYACRWLAYHLVEAGQVARLRELLLDFNFLQAMRQFPTGYAGIKEGLKLALAQFRDPLDLQLVPLAAGLHCLRHALPIPTANAELELKVWLGQEADALDKARARSRPNAVCSGLLAVFDALAEKRKGDHRAAILDEAETVAKNVCSASSSPDPWTPNDTFDDRGGAFERIVKRWCIAGNLARAKQLAESIPTDSHSQLTASVHIAASFARLGEDTEADVFFRAAEKLASRLAPERLLSRHLSALAIALAESRRFERAKEIVALMRSKNRRHDEAQTLRELCVQLAKARRFPESRAVADAMSERGPALIEKSYAFACLALELHVAEKAPEADEAFAIAANLAETIGGLGPKDKCRWLMLPSLLSAGRQSRAEELAEAIELLPWKAYALFAMRNSLMKAGDAERAGMYFDRGCDAVAKAENSLQAIGLFEEMGRALAFREEHEMGQLVFERAISIVQDPNLDQDKSEATTRLAVALAQTGSLDRAKCLAAALEDDKPAASGGLDSYGWKNGVWDGLGSALASCDYPELAVGLGHQIPPEPSPTLLDLDEYKKTEKAIRALVGLGKGYSSLAREDVDSIVAAQDLQELESKAALVSKPIQRVKALCAAALRRYENGDEEMSTATLKLARTVAINEGNIDGDCGGVFNMVVIAAIGMEQVPFAQDIIPAIPSSAGRTDALCAIAEAMVTNGCNEEAEKLYSEMERGVSEEDFQTCYNWSSIVRSLIRTGQFFHAERVMGLIPRSEHRLHAYCEALKGFYELNEYDRACKAIAEAERLARLSRSVDGFYSVCQTLIQIGEKKRYRDLRDEAEATARLIGGGMFGDHNRSEALGRLAMLACSVGDFAVAFRTLDYESVGGFVDAISKCGDYFEPRSKEQGKRENRGLFLDALKRVVRICTWVDPRWQKTCQVLERRTS